MCRGTASCSDVPMDKDLFIDLGDFAKAFRKEAPPGVRLNVKNGTAMEIDRHGKSRFELLCARIPLCPAHNSLQADQGDTQLYPVKIKAIQGHSEISLKNAGGLFATAAAVMCAPTVLPERQAAFAGVPKMWRTIAHNGATGRASPKVD